MCTKRVFKILASFILLWSTTTTRLADSQVQSDAMPCAVTTNSFELTQRKMVFTENYDAYRDFINSFDKGFVIPGLDEGFVPQGIAYSEGKKEFLLSGYMADDGCAMIVCVNRQSGLMTGEHKIVKPDGEIFLSHSGGIAVYGKNIYVTDGYVLCCIGWDSLLSPTSDAVVSDEIMLPASASFLCVYDGYLWCGNFFHNSFAGKYDKSSTDGYCTTYHTAIVAYRLSLGAKCGIVSQNNVPRTATPYLVIFAPDEVQGLAIRPCGDMVLSCSYGRRVMSCLMVYEYPPKWLCDSKISIGGNVVPCWVLTPERLKKSIVAPPMSEGVCTIGNTAYMIFESASQKYLQDSLNPTDCVWKLCK